MRKKRFLSFVFGVCISCCCIWAQQVVSSTGTSFSNSNLSIDFTIGECFIHTCTSPEFCITQGFHQPTFKITTAIEPVALDFKVSVYPNPASELVILRVDKPTDLTYSLFDLSGRIIDFKKLESNLTEIPLEELKPATYFLQVADKEKVLRLFEIVKQ